MRKGLLMIVIGAFLLFRTVNKDATGRTLIDRILGNKGKSQAQLASAAQLGAINAATFKPQSTSTKPAASVSGISTPARPSMLGDPFARFPSIHSPFDVKVFRPGVTPLP